MGQLDDAFRDAADEVAQMKAQPSNRYWWLYGTIKEKNDDGTIDVEIDGVTIQHVKSTVSCIMANVSDRVIVLKAGPLMTCVDVIATSNDIKVPALSITGTLPVSNGGTGATTAAGARSALGAVSKSGDTVAGPISRAGGGAFMTARDNSTVCGTSHGQQFGYSFNAVASQLTSLGSWTMGNLSGEESLSFAYTTNEDYDAGNNTASLVKLPAKQGTIVTSASVGSGLKFHDGTLSVDNWDYVKKLVESSTEWTYLWGSSGSYRFVRWCVRMGVCHLQAYRVNGITSSGWQAGVLPASARPDHSMWQPATPRHENNTAQMWVGGSKESGAEGQVWLYNNGTYDVSGSVSWPIYL